MAGLPVPVVRVLWRQAERAGKEGHGGAEAGRKQGSADLMEANLKR